MSQRKQLNLQIVDALRDYICKHPEQRFGQALRNIGIVDTVSVEIHTRTATRLNKESHLYFDNIFYEEPEITLKKIMERLEEDGQAN